MGQENTVNSQKSYSPLLIALRSSDSTHKLCMWHSYIALTYSVHLPNKGAGLGARMRMHNGRHEGVGLSLKPHPIKGGADAGAGVTDLDTNSTVVVYYYGDSSM